MLKIKCLDHIGVAVKDLDRSIKKFETVLGAELITKTEVDRGGTKLNAAYLKLGENIIVLDSSDDPSSSMARYVSKHGEGLHHLCFEVDDIVKALDELKQQNIDLLNNEPMRGHENKKIAFLDVTGGNDFLIELCKKTSD